MEAKRNAKNHGGAVAGVADGAVLGLAEGEEHRRGGGVEEGLPEAEGEDGHHPGGVFVAVIVELEDDDVAEADHEAEQHGAAEQGKAAVLQEARAELRHGHMDELGDEGIADAVAELLDDGARNVGECGGDAVDAEDGEAGDASEDEAVGLAGEEEEAGAEEDPLAEVEDAVACFSLPAKGVADAGDEAGPVADGEAIDVRQHGSADDGPDRWVEVSPGDGEDGGDDLSAEVDGKEAADAHVAGERKQVGAVEAGDDGGEREDGEEDFELGVVVEGGKRKGDEERDEPEQDAANGLEGPGGVEEGRLVAARGLNDALAEADIGEQADADDEGGDEGDLAEVSRQQQVREDEAVDDAEHLACAILDGGPDGGEDGFGLQDTQLGGLLDSGCFRAHAVSPFRPDGFALGVVAVRVRLKGIAAGLSITGETCCLAGARKGRRTNWLCGKRCVGMLQPFVVAQRTEFLWKP